MYDMIMHHEVHIYVQIYVHGIEDIWSFKF